VPQLAVGNTYTLVAGLPMSAVLLDPGETVTVVALNDNGTAQIQIAGRGPGIVVITDLERAVGLR
jgi:hypothetical protein